jgi:hypothetical protein
MAKPATLTIIITFLVLIGYFLAGGWNLYNRLSWIDSALHFLGGMWVANFILYLAEQYKAIRFLRTKNKINFVILVALVTLVAVFWEFFEFSLSYFNENIVDVQKKFYTDTILDLAFDLLGAIAGFLIAKKNDSPKDQEPKIE